MQKVLCLLGLTSLVASSTHYKEEFGADWEERWVHSKAKSDFGRFVRTAGKWYGDAEADKGIQTSQDARFYAIGSNFPKSFTNKGQDLVIQFQVKHEQNIDCGGGYIKLFPAQKDLEKLDGETKYNVMFGPDVCGATKKIHFIFNYKGQNLLWKKEPRAETDVFSHVYTAIIHPDNTYEVQVDGEKRESGKLDEDWDFLKPKTIPDPSDKKPADWVDQAEIADPEDKKPADWDNEPQTIADPDASQPDDWDEEEDGAWEPPQIPNPKFKGEWKPKMIPNPAYKGVWKAKEIPNPEYVEDDQLYAYEDFGAVGIDVWQVKSGSIFDNIIVTDSIAEAKELFDATFAKSKDAERKAHDKQEEEKRKKDEESSKAKEADADDDDDDKEADEKPHDEF
eukprot:TRINITY_DN58534_c0_g1_i1.p1 TRINITY_DN58534_c0_g1~~TRINITY_DN58534_c0_g1_i1.p1  ORF type:complete len:394 (-),score=120.00 TRINITY_DN58534_c0_g1_i1:42-1223(-)